MAIGVVSNAWFAWGKLALQDAFPQSSQVCAGCTIGIQALWAQVLW